MTQTRAFDTVTIHMPKNGDPSLNTAEMEPSALLLSPLHPLRIGWQVRVQTLLAQARDSAHFCHLASELDADCCPPSWSLSGGESLWRFLAAKNLSNYWSVMISEDALATSHDLEEYDTLKLAMPEPIKTLTGSHSGILSAPEIYLPAQTVVSLEGSVNASDKLFDGIMLVCCPKWRY